MSKAGTAKYEQGYVERVVPPTCSNCKHFRFDRVQTHPPTTFNLAGYFEDKNMRCGIGWFAVKKTATCKLHEHKP